jgi:quinol monooxygenase YgiN
MIHILAHWRAKDGKHQEVMALVKDMILKTRAEPGCMLYDAYQNIEDPHFILLDELYASDEAVDAHRNSEHFQIIVQEKIAPLLAARSSQKTEKN